MSLPQRVLVVDDDVLVLDTTAVVVEHLGFEVTTARTSAEALFAAKENSPDVALVDFYFPDTDGIELTKQLRAVKPGLRVVMISARDAFGAAVAEEAREAGVEDFVAKPFSITDIERAIKGN